MPTPAFARRRDRTYSDLARLGPAPTAAIAGHQGRPYHVAEADLRALRRDGRAIATTVSGRFVWSAATPAA